MILLLNFGWSLLGSKKSREFRSVELRRIRKIIEQKQAHIAELWNEYFDD